MTTHKVGRMVTVEKGRSSYCTVPYCDARPPFLLCLAEIPILFNVEILKVSKYPTVSEGRAGPANTETELS